MYLAQPYIRQELVPNKRKLEKEKKEMEEKTKSITEKDVNSLEQDNHIQNSGSDKNNTEEQLNQLPQKRTNENIDNITEESKDNNEINEKEIHNEALIIKEAKKKQKLEGKESEMNESKSETNVANNLSTKKVEYSSQKSGRKQPRVRCKTCNNIASSNCQFQLCKLCCRKKMKEDENNHHDDASSSPIICEAHKPHNHLKN